MKVVIGIMLFFCFSALSLFGQLMVGYQYNLDVYKPYTKLAQEYMDLNSSVESQIQTAYIAFPVLKRGKNTIRLGLNYKRIDHNVKKRVEYVPVYQIGNHQHIFIGNYPSTADLKSQSNYFGLHLDFNRNLFEKGKYKGSIGAFSEIYLVEYFKSEYHFYGITGLENAPFPHEYDSYQPLKPLNSEERNVLSPSLSNVSIYYLNTFQLTEQFSLGLRVSAGTNIYSKWDQFSRYAWVGLGLELGFG